jgi:NAD(P)-dependent dehydrogenase (short-subunit alcohol dehydrogenase family)
VGGCLPGFDRAIQVEKFKEFGRIDILLNNAGMSAIAESSVQVSEEHFDKIVDGGRYAP